MKKKLVTALCILGMVSGLVACGGTEEGKTPTESGKTEVSTQQEMGTENENSQVVDMETEQEKETEITLPEDRAWIDEVYNDLLAGNIDDLIAVVTSEDLEEKVAPYIMEHWAMWDYEEAYALVTTDEKIVGVILYDNESYIFYSENGNGFDEVCQGDFMFSYYKKDGSYDWFDGNTVHYSTGRTYTLGPNEILMVWHM